jgi:hypothetical protein
VAHFYTGKVSQFYSGQISGAIPDLRLASTCQATKRSGSALESRQRISVGIVRPSRRVTPWPSVFCDLRESSQRQSEPSAEVHRFRHRHRQGREAGNGDRGEREKADCRSQNAGRHSRRRDCSKMLRSSLVDASSPKSLARPEVHTLKPRVHLAVACQLSLCASSACHSRVSSISMQCGRKFAQKLRTFARGGISGVGRSTHRSGSSVAETP